MRSWYFSGLLAILVLNPEAGLGQVPVTIPDTTASPGDTLELPIRAAFSNEQAIISAQFKISYDQSLLVPLGVSIDGETLPQAAQWELQYNLVSGRIAVALAGGDSLTTAGVLAYIRFVVDEGASADQSSPVRIDSLIFNEGDPSGIPQDGSVTVTVVDVEETGAGTGLPMDFALQQNYPNPFNPVTTMRYELPQATEVTLVVYDLLGREVARLVEGTMEPGSHQAHWDGRDRYSRMVPSGIYIARLVAPPKTGQKAREYSQAIKMLLIR